MFCAGTLRFAQHHCRIQPGTPKPNIVAMTYFTAGVRIFDISNPTAPKEITWFVPPRDGEIDNYRSWGRSNKSQHLFWPQLGVTGAG